MAFDGITIANIISELKATLIGGRIYKIAQPENDELILTVKVADRETGQAGQKRLFISADASLPLLYLTDANKPSPATAPAFCMLLRKHLNNGRITAITGVGLERIVHLHIEHLNELGDLCRKKIIIEIMGKHSNIIFVDDNDVIIDSIKRISGMVSSVREVLPGRPYFIAAAREKHNPLAAAAEEFAALIPARGLPLAQALYDSYTGLSPLIAAEMCFRAGLDSDRSAAAIQHDKTAMAALYRAFTACMTAVNDGHFSPAIYYDAHDRHQPRDFSVLPLTMYQDLPCTAFDSVSALLEHYYAAKNALTRIRQKSADLRKIVQTVLERCRKKYDLQILQMKDTAKKDRYRIYGELLNTYGYGAAPGAKSLDALNYYTGENITIPLDPTLTAAENAQKYFARYNKLKRTAEALTDLIRSGKEELEYLESVATALDIALMEEDLAEIKEELTESGYIRRRGHAKKPKILSRPFHYLSSDGFHIYVGKNNYQNDELTFKFAGGGDWWFHAKKIPGSHVIVKTDGAPLPDRSFEEAARLAAYYSQGRAQEKVEVDYTEKKHVKKPGGGKPGLVIYHTNYSMIIEPNIEGLAMVK